MSDRERPGGDEDKMLVFAAEEQGGLESPEFDLAAASPYSLLIVDDEQEVHTMTRLVLKNYQFEGRGLHLLSAYSGVGARQVLRDHPGVAVILLDVVMEREDSGLKLVRYIREELGNHMVRIILRTGQPGQAPEMEVVAQYDINDYKAKTELTAQKLFTTVTSALRSWRDLQTIARSRRGLRRVIDASGPLFAGHATPPFCQGVLDNLLNLAGPEDIPGSLDSSHRAMSGLVALGMGDELVIQAGRGQYAGYEGRLVDTVVRDTAGHMVSRAGRMGCEFFFNNSFVSCIKGDEGKRILFLVRGEKYGISLDKDLIRIYMAKVALAFHNMNLNQEMIETQKEIIHTLGEVVETRSKETANHVLRVGMMAQLLAAKAGLSDEDVQTIRVAAPMHDVGKVGIPDAILNKPGKLTAEEYEVIKTHAIIGHEILAKSSRRIIKAAAVVAHQHHEHWNGEGYPQGLQGKAIHIFGRITAIVDVFDAVINKRCYREPKELAEVVKILRTGRDTHFDPELVDIFLAHLTEFLSIVQAYPDHPPRRGLQQQAQACGGTGLQRE
jgi:response regulator RpfG family c-di-GMP phosphodiesterase